MSNIKTIPITLKDTIDSLTIIIASVEGNPKAITTGNLFGLQNRLKDRLHTNKLSWHVPSIIVGALGATAISLLLCTGSIHAAERDSLDVNLTSWHADKTYKYNSNNFGLGFTKSINHHWQGKVGFYQNSYNKTSLYAMANLKHDMKNWRWGVQFGFVTGYDKIASKNEMQSKFPAGQKNRPHTSHESDDNEHSIPKHRLDTRSHSHAKNMNAIQFMVLPTVTWKVTKHHALQLGYMPSFSKDTFAFATLQYQYSFDI